MKRLAALLLSLLFVCPTIAHAVEKGFTVYHADRESNRIAITVDDCYNSISVRHALEIAQKYGVPFTFFPVGSALKEEDAELWRDIVDAGCEIGNHTFSHASIWRLSPPEIVYQLQRHQQQLDTVLGYHYPMNVMRPPYGKAMEDNARPLNAIESAGYSHSIIWDVSQTDAKKAIRQVKNGSILLYHANPPDLKCLDVLIPQLLEKGFEPVTVSELLGLEEIATSTDLFVYQP